MWDYTFTQINGIRDGLTFWLFSLQVESFVIDNSELDEDSRIAAKFLLSEDPEHTVDPETQARLEALLEAAGEIFIPHFSSNS
jgi:hypothetical protein